MKKVKGFIILGAILAGIVFAVVTITTGQKAVDAVKGGPSYPSAEEVATLTGDTFTAELAGTAIVQGVGCSDATTDLSAQSEVATGSYVCLALVVEPSGTPHCYAFGFTLVDGALPPVEGRQGQEIDPAECGA